MYLPLGTFSPKTKIGLVSASRNCFPRALSQKRTDALLKACRKKGIKLFVPKGECRIIESKAHAQDAAAQMRAAGCDAAVLYLGNFSPEIEDACFVKQFGGACMIIAAAEESAASLACDRGDALCGLLSATLATGKRGLSNNIHIPQNPLVSAQSGAEAIGRFTRIIKVYKGMRNATIGLFGPRPRDFETCNYNLASVAGLGIEVEELGLFDLQNEIARVRNSASVTKIMAAMKKEMAGRIPDDFIRRLAAFEKAVLNLRQSLKLSGMTTQCWSEQEFSLKHVPCYINARMAAKGFPIACENDAYSLIAELMGQYASGSSVTILDLNHSIPKNLHPGLAKLPAADLVGLFHCGNTDPKRLKKPAMKHQVIMKRLMEPDTEPDITRGTIEGQIKASPLTMMQVHGVGDAMRAYIAEGKFLDVDPATFGATGTAYIPGFGRFYRHALLGRFHHHTAVAFDHCGSVLYDALKLLGVSEIFTPLPANVSYPGENPFESGIAAK
jgi:L-fucose isomerase-like protein